LLATFGAVALLASPSLGAQTLEDGVMMRGKALCTGFLYTHESWDHYWEGTLKRDNGNIGTLTTQSVAWFGNYGITDRLNVIAMVPYVWTGASQGVLMGQDGFQDMTLAAKFRLLQTAFTSRGSLNAIVVGSLGAPTSDYTPDFYPLSIGSASRRAALRTIMHFDAAQGWFLTGSAAYTWRGNVTLDRVSYFTDGQLYLTDEVAMPDVFDYTVSAGYRKGPIEVPITFSQQTTLGGGDIHRQDMPFVSNRMNASRVEGLAMYYLPKVRNLSVHLGASYTFNGRNVGQATSLTAGLLYLFHF
jgi:hypothetical protein